MSKVKEAPGASKTADAAQAFAPMLKDVIELAQRKQEEPAGLKAEIKAAGIEWLLESAMDAESKGKETAPFIYEMLLKKLGISRHYSATGDGRPFLNEEVASGSRLEAIAYIADLGLSAAEKSEDPDALRYFKGVARLANNYLSRPPSAEYLPSEQPQLFIAIKKESEKESENIYISRNFIAPHVPEIFQSDGAGRAFMYRHRIAAFDKIADASKSRLSIENKFNSLISCYSGSLPDFSEFKLVVEKTVVDGKEIFISSVIAELRSPNSREDMLLAIGVVDKLAKLLSEQMEKGQEAEK